MAGSAALHSSYLVSEAVLQGLTADERAQRDRLQKSINAKPVKKGCVRCFHCTDFKGGFHILESGLRPSKAYNEQQKRWNLAAGAFVTRLSPLDFGFPAKGWLGNLLNNNYGKNVEDASGDPAGKWVQERGQVCLVLDIVEWWLRNSHEDDAKYREEGRNVYSIPKSTFDESGVDALSPECLVYAFLSTLEEPPRALTALTKKRLGHALMAGDLFDARWLLELGAPLQPMQRNRLLTLTQPEQTQDLDEAAHIQTILWERQVQQEQRFQQHLTPKKFQLVQRAMRSWAGPDAVGGAVGKLDLSEGDIDPEGASLLAEALEHNNYLRSLCLWFNGIGDQGASALGEALKLNSRLTSLDLIGNGIGGQGASALGEALKHNSCLQSLSLGYNRIGDQGASALGEGLKHNSCLQSLSLSQNGISDQGAAMLEEALRCNASLKALNLGRNKISARGVSAMAGCRRPMLRIDLDCQEEHKGLCVIA